MCCCRVPSHCHNTAFHSGGSIAIKPGATVRHANPTSGRSGSIPGGCGICAAGGRGAHCGTGRRPILSHE